MAVYTMQLRTYIEKFSQYEDNLSLEERIEIGREKLFDFDYPFYSENYRKQFETNFIYEFYMREIGFESEALFKMRLRNWLMKNMPYYNKLFESELFKYDPLSNSRMHVIHKKENDKEQNDLRNIDQLSNTRGTGSTQSEQDGQVDSSQKTQTDTEQSRDKSEQSEGNEFNREIQSDTPQNRLQLTTDGGVIEYASNITENDTNRDSAGSENESIDSSSDSRSTGERKDRTEFQSQDETNVDSSAEQEDRLKSDINELESFEQEREGKIGVQSYGKLIQDYRDTLLRIEVQIHDEMQELFMLVY